jgi:hypothetical protein
VVLLETVEWRASRKVRASFQRQLTGTESVPGAVGCRRSCPQGIKRPQQ